MRVPPPKFIVSFAFCDVSIDLVWGFGDSLNRLGDTFYDWNPEESSALRGFWVWAVSVVCIENKSLFAFCSLMGW